MNRYTWGLVWHFVVLAACGVEPRHTEQIDVDAGSPTVRCENLSCGGCSQDPECAFCPSSGQCAPIDQCVFRLADDNMCDGLVSPCLHGRCYDGSLAHRGECMSESVRETFASESFNIHRYTLAMNAGSHSIEVAPSGMFEPFVWIADISGQALYLGESDLRSDVAVEAGKNANGGLSLRIETENDVRVFLYLSDAKILQDGWAVSVPHDAAYDLTWTPPCTD